MILAATGEANNSADSYFGLGILRSTDAGKPGLWSSTANNGALSFTGLGGTRMAFKGQTNVVVSAMATRSEGLIDGAVTANTKRGLYTSINAGQSWTYNALVDPGGADGCDIGDFGRLQRDCGPFSRPSVITVSILRRTA